MCLHRNRFDCVKMVYRLLVDKLDLIYDVIYDVKQIMLYLFHARIQEIFSGGGGGSEFPEGV